MEIIKWSMRKKIQNSSIRVENQRMANHKVFLQNFQKYKLYQSDGKPSRRWEIIQNDGNYFVNLFSIIIIVFHFFLSNSKTFQTHAAMHYLCLFKIKSYIYILILYEQGILVIYLQINQTCFLISNLC